MPKRYFTIMLEAKRPDGQYGIQAFAVEAYDEEEAKKLAIRDAEEDGVTEIKYLFTIR